MTTFSELSTQVHKLKDMILTDMVYDIDSAEDSVKFSKHLHCTKFWFARTSWVNKKRYLLCLLNEIKSAWALSWILKSIWNCYTKDAIVSSCEPKTLSSYDVAPMDHNRTALPVATLAQAMANDRKWFHTLPPESQAAVLAELLTIAGGPIMWTVYKRAHVIYDRYRESQLQAIMDSVDQGSMTDSPKKSGQNVEKKPKPAKVKGRENVEHEAPYLHPWLAAIKSIRERVKLEEVEVMFKDGSAKKIWKVNRIKPEIIEAVDFIQLLPSAIAKRVLSYLPLDQLNQYSQVNKYWAFLIEELKDELTSRTKIDAIMGRLQSLMFRHDSNLGQMPPDLFLTQPASVGTTMSARKPYPSLKLSMKSGKSGKSVFTMPHPITEQALKTAAGERQKHRPICSMAELNGRLEARGAADENIFQWCENIAKEARRARRRAVREINEINAKNKYKPQIPTVVEEPKKTMEGVLPSMGMFFPCPLLKIHLDIPMVPPLAEDPTLRSAAPLKRNISNMASMNLAPQDLSQKHVGLWSKDFSSLYHAYKIPSHLSPI